MESRIITLRYSEESQGFPDDAVRAATDGMRVVHMGEHFFVHNNVPHLAVALLCDDSGQATAGRISSAQELVAAPDADLSEDQRILFEALRSWRSEVAKSAQKPAYAIAKNTQLVRIVKAKPKTLEELKVNAKMSDAFCERNGDDVLKIVSASFGELKPKVSDGKHWWKYSG